MDSKRKASPVFAGPSYQQLLDDETNPVPDSLRDNTLPYLGSENIKADRYTSREFHDLEVEHVWKKPGKWCVETPSCPMQVTPRSTTSPACQ